MASKRHVQVSVLGLGTVGLPTALYLSNYFKVKGYDIERKTVELAALKGLDATTSWPEARNASVFVITVTTAVKGKGRPDISAIRDVFSKVSDSNHSSLVCVESTVPVGSCRSLSERFGLEYVVHCPHRYWSEDPINHGVVQPQVLGAINKKSLEAGKRFYDTLKIPVHLVSSIEVAEISKIAENASRFVQISFAEELSLICKKLCLSFDEVRTACNTKWNIKILEAREGISRYCLPKDVKYLWKISKTPLLSGAIRTDQQYKAATHSDKQEADVR
jgi:nucleotide sugar dehydrogenase